MQMKLFLNLTSKDQYTHRDWDHGIKPLPYFLLHLKITVTAGAWRGTRRFYVYCIVLMIIGTTCNVQRTLGEKNAKVVFWRRNSSQIMGIFSTGMVDAY